MSAKYKQFPSSRFVLGILLLINCCCFSVVLADDIFAKSSADIDPAQKGVEFSEEKPISFSALKGVKLIDVYSKESGMLSFEVVHPEFDCESADKESICKACLIYADACYLNMSWACDAFGKGVDLKFKGEDRPQTMGNEALRITLNDSTAILKGRNRNTLEDLCLLKAREADDGSSEFKFKHSISFELYSGTCDAKLEFDSKEYKLLATTTTTPAPSTTASSVETTDSSTANPNETVSQDVTKADFPVWGIVGIVVAAIVIVLVIAGCLYWYFCIYNKEENGDSIEEGRTDAPSDFIVPDKLSNTPIDTNVPSVVGIPSKTPDTTEKKKGDKKKDVKEPSSANKSGKKKDTKISPKKDAKK